jgi:hypothetical protein
VSEAVAASNLGDRPASAAAIIDDESADVILDHD